MINADRSIPIGQGGHIVVSGTSSCFECGHDGNNSYDSYVSSDCSRVESVGVAVTVWVWREDVEWNDFHFDELNKRETNVYLPALNFTHPTSQYTKLW